MSLYAGDEYAATDPDLDDDGPWEDPAPAPMGDQMSAAELIQAMTDACADASNLYDRYRRDHRWAEADAQMVEATRIRKALDIALEFYRLADEPRAMQPGRLFGGIDGTPHVIDVDDPGHILARGDDTIVWVRIADIAEGS